MLRSIFLPLLFVALCGLATARAEQDLYNPLAVGMRWDVDVEITKPAGKPEHGTAVRQITGTEKIGNYTYFIVVMSFTGLPDMKELTFYRRKSARGLYAIYAIDPKKEEYLEEALPMKVGQTWTSNVGGQVISSSVEAIESVKVGDKTYDNCVKVRYKSADGSLTGTYYEAPDVGSVLETTNHAGILFKFSLKAFSGLK